MKTYSLGMRQRLGLAQALLKDPELLILDEPANGLDPAGIKEIRELLRSLGDEGRTVFVSSHLLVEIQHTCDRVAILTQGRCVASGTVDEVLQRGHRHDPPGGGARPRRRPRAPSPRRASPRPATTPAWRSPCRPAEAARVSETLARRELWVTELHADEATLEDVFLELTDAPRPRGGLLMMHMLGIEIRRCFARRLVRWLIVVAVVGCVVHRVSSPTDPRATRAAHDPFAAGRAARAGERRLLPRRRRRSSC